MTSASSGRRRAEFTYECFCEAMDNFRYFNFFFNRACGIACKIGVRNDELKKDFAMTAIEDFCRKVDKFDSSRGKFSSFFDATIGNSIKDQIRKALRDGAFGLNNPDRDGLEDCGDSLTDEEETLILRREEFANEMVGEFKKFFDSLPDDKRLIIYSSDFGRKIRSVMGEDPSKRGYADLIEVRTKRTDAAIRRIAAELKKKALAYVEDRGYSRSTFNTLGFITTSPVEDTVDYSSLDWTALSGVQRLKLRMYLYEMAVADGIISEDASDGNIVETPKEMIAYERGKRAAIESVTEIMKRLKTAEENLEKSREEKNLLSFTYWFTLIHEYNYLLRTYPNPEEIEEVFSEIDNLSTEEYLKHKKKCGYNRLPDYHTVYGAGYNFPDIIGCALSDRCAEDILSFEPKILE